MVVQVIAFFRVMSHQFYGEPSCHMNARYVGVI